MLAEEIKNMNSVAELLEIQRKTPERIGKHLPDSLNGLYALGFSIATGATEETAVELLELINCFDEQKGEQFSLLPMRDLQTMAGSLLLDKIWKEGWKVENSKAFWKYNAKREAASLSKNLRVCLNFQEASCFNIIRIIAKWIKAFETSVFSS